MTTEQITPLIMSLLSALIGGGVVALVNHLLTARRERSRKLADLRIQTLIDAWRKIEASVIPPNDTSYRDMNSISDGIEGAIASIILLGHSNEVKLAEEVCRDFSSGKGVSVDLLLKGLKSSIRRELGLKGAVGENFHLRVYRDKQK
ncbi:hypothetical protein NAC44_04985 [Allorhizobium sp. BGMRC 0089]|uniref:hypothetical protein n=1 Tax=Allorhizobium sonneratiae TaxID=2934936 RepID=UPI002033E7D6|nr:hypothetical protein [Allorhizobium sonneratiae]MCM2291682.1 hypothetical protein [Allorhizobium sonneratiae]